MLSENITLNYLNKRNKVINEEIKDIDKFKDELRKIREDSIKNLKQYWEEAKINLEKNGIKVYFANDSKDVKKILKKIIPKNSKIAKSKSNVIKELNLDMDVLETDCGDFLVKLLGKKGHHPVIPAFDLKPKYIVKEIKKRLGYNVKAEAEEIVKFVRKYLHKKILNCNVGLTGVNIVSKEGSLFLLENEGNISLVSRLPIHIAITSIDKIVSNNEDALKIIKALSIWGTGTRSSSYVNIISGPSKTADVDNKLITGMHGSKEVHLIVIDNGRSKLIEDGLQEFLYCINCGACLFFCPAYRVNEDYGYIYYGPKGLAFNYLFKKDLNVLYSCTTCKSCTLNCPVKINTPELITKIRNKVKNPNTKKMIENVKNYGNPFGKAEKIDELYCC